MTWDEMATMDDRLAELERDARALARADESMAESAWAGMVKPRMVAIVGWHRGDGSPLATSFAYGVAARHLYDVTTGGKG